MLRKAKMSFPNCLIVDEMHASLLPMLAGIGVVGDYRPGLTTAEVPAALAAQIGRAHV